MSGFHKEVSRLGCLNAANTVVDSASPGGSYTITIRDRTIETRHLVSINLRRGVSLVAAGTTGAGGLTRNGAYSGLLVNQGDIIDEKLTFDYAPGSVGTGISAGGGCAVLGGAWVVAGLNRVAAGGSRLTAGGAVSAIDAISISDSSLEASTNNAGCGGGGSTSGGGAGCSHDQSANEARADGQLGVAAKAARGPWQRGRQPRGWCRLREGSGISLAICKHHCRIRRMRRRRQCRRHFRNCNVFQGDQSQTLEAALPFKNLFILER